MAAFTMSSYLGWAGAALGGIFACWFVSTAHRGMQVPREQSDKIKLEKQSRNREMYSRAISLQKVSPIYMIHLN